MSARIYYDGDCPFCSHYTGLLRLKDAVGPVELIDLREDVVARDELQAEGYDVDQGMVVDMNGRRLGGAEATNALAMMSTPSGAFNTFTRLLFANPTVSHVVYPVLRSGRWITLFLMGREAINQSAEASKRQVLFSFFFAFFSLFHVFNYVFPYDRFPPSLDLIGVFVAAVLLIARPQSSRALFLLMLASLISTIAQAPAQSNHTMLRTAVIVGYWLSFLWTFLRGKPAPEIFANFVLAGRGSLLIMYVFGIFHKINTDFLNPDTSCALYLWREMPWPLNAIEGSMMDFLAIYGTFAVEGAIMLALLFTRTRYIGLVCGIFFHLLLGLSDYAAYVAFTTLSIALHVLFLDKSQSEAITASPEMAAIRARMVQPVYMLAGLALLAGGALAMSQHNFTLTNVYLLPFVLPLCYLILRYGYVAEDRHSHSRAAWIIGIAAAGLYFASAAAPYFGLKTAQSINMFANLRLEAGVSNHLVFRNAPGPFGYLEDVATITDAGGSAFLRDYQIRGFSIVYYDLLAHLADNPEVTVNYTMAGETFTGVNAKARKEEIDHTIHAPFIRKWFHFQPVQMERPERCSL